MEAIPSSLSLSMNPAALPLMGSSEIAFNHLSYAEGIQYSLVSCAFMSGNDAVFAGTFGRLGSGSITRTVADGSLDGYSEAGSFEYGDLLLQGAYGMKTGRHFSWGAALTGVRETIDGNSSSGMMASAGGLYDPGKGKWSFGFGVKNLGPRVKGYDLPTAGYFGFGRMVTEDLFWGGEAALYLDSESVLRTGLEYHAGPHVSLRCGYRHFLNDPGMGEMLRVNLTAGFGFLFDRFGLDYAWLPYGDLGDTHRVTLAARFGKAGSSRTEARMDAVIVKKGIKENSERVTVAVIDFAAKNAAAPDAVIVSNFFREAFAGIPGTGVVGREETLAARERLGRPAGEVSEQSAARIGSMTGARQVVTGVFSRYLDRYFVSIRVIDTGSGKLVYAGDESVDAVAQIRAMCVSMAEKVRGYKELR